MKYKPGTTLYSPDQRRSYVVISYSEHDLYTVRWYNHDNGDITSMKGVSVVSLDKLVEFGFTNVLPITIQTDQLPEELFTL